jgi:AcrR family transcriptional regulator
LKSTVRNRNAGQSEPRPEFERRQQIIAEAAKLFVKNGFDGTSIREIAAVSGILSGSLYHHFSSKEEIFVAVHAAGIDILVNSVRAATEGIKDPWDRLAAAASAHCIAVLESGAFMVLVQPAFPASIGSYRDTIVQQRDRYEKLIGELVAELDLPAEINRVIFRLHFLGALNWAQTWFRRDGKIKPGEIGRQLVMMLKPVLPKRPAKRR